LSKDPAPAEEASPPSAAGTVRPGPDAADGRKDDRSPQHAGDHGSDPEHGSGHPPDRPSDHEELGAPGRPFSRHSPFYVGFFGGLGALLAFWLGSQLLQISGTLLLVVVAMFLAAGLNPLVEFFVRRGLRHSLAVVAVIGLVLGALTLFVLAIVPVISDQVASITKNAPVWLDELQRNQQVQDLNQKYDLIDRAKSYIEGGGFTSSLFGGVLGFGLAIVSTLLNAFIVVVLTLYFLSSLQTTKNALYRLAPESRRERVSKLGDRVLDGIGGYVSGAFIVATCAGITSLIFLFIVGLGEYAVALAFVVALLDVIPMIGATIGAVIVTAIGFATDPKIGLACLIFYLIYQQVENYVIYPRVMSKSVDIPGAVTVIAALAGAALLGVVGALLAIPTAAAILMLTREVFIRKQDAR
jgi:predicted PurR-regulated permease PerM